MLDSQPVGDASDSGEPREGVDVVVGELHAHEPYDSRESAHKASILDFLGSSPRPFDRHAFDPGHIVGSACVVSPDAGAIVLVAHRTLGRWLQPGGHIESTDLGPRGAAAREVREEVGVRLDADHAELLDLDVHRIPEGRDPTHLHFDLRYLWTVPPQDLRARSDARDARWISQSEADELDLDDGLRRIIAKCAHRGLLSA